MGESSFSGKNHLLLEGTILHWFVFRNRLKIKTLDWQETVA